MKGKIGYPTRIVTPVPHMREPVKIESRELSEKAKFRLKVIDRYFRESGRFSLSGKPDASLACRHFGIHRPYFYRWKKRYGKRRLSLPENRSTAPASKREPEYSREVVRAVREIRKAGPGYSGKKIRPVLLRGMSGRRFPVSRLWEGP